MGREVYEGAAAGHIEHVGAACGTHDAARERKEGRSGR